MKYYLEFTILFALFISNTLAGCYNDWKELQKDVESSGEGETFVVCPDTTFKPGSFETEGVKFTDIWLSKSNIKLLCGEDGSSVNNCVFDGGKTHLYVPDRDINGLYVSGFTFKNAEETSVLLYGSPSSDATFHDCHWKKNAGPEGAAVNVWHTYEMRGTAQSVIFEKCSFEHNDAEDGTVLIEGGSAIFQQCIFNHNTGGWPIELQLDSTAKVFNNCFQGNSGPIFVYEGSNIVSQENNYAVNNNRDEYRCEGSWDEIDGDCNDFTATECMSDLDVSSGFRIGGRSVAWFLYIALSFMMHI